MARRKGWLKAWARALKTEVLVVYFAARDPATPWPWRVLALLVAAYALSPIDLIPDFIPLLGYLDDLILVPLGLWLILRHLPPAVLVRARERAAALLQKPRSWASAVVFVLLWLALVVLLLRWLGSAAS